MQGWHLFSRIHIRIASAMAAMAKLYIIWRPNTISSHVSSSSTILLSPPSSYMAVKHGPCLLTKKKKDPGFRNKMHEETSQHLLLGAQHHRWDGARLPFLWVHRSLFWQLSRDGNLHGSGMSHTTTASPKTSARAPWGVGDAVVGRENARWTTSKSGHPCPC